MLLSLNSKNFGLAGGIATKINEFKGTLLIPHMKIKIIKFENC